MSSELGEAAARTETATESIEDSAEDLSSELGEAATESELATESIESSAEEMTSELGQAAAKTEAATESIEDSAEEMSSGLAQAAAKTEAATESIESSLRDLPSGQRLNQLGEQAERAGRDMTEAGQRVAMAGGAMLAPIAGAVTQAGRFEKAMVEVQKVTDETIAENLAGPIEDLSTRIPRASTELAGLAADAARFGVQGQKNILAFTESTAKMATATDLSTEEAGTAFAKLATLTDTPIPKVKNLGSSINALSNNMATSSQEIVDSMLRSSQALDNLGLSATEMPAISAALNEVSESSERAGTRLKRFAQELLNPDKVQDVASALGMTASQFTQMREESPVDLIRQMATSFNEGGQQADQLRSVLSSVSRQTLSGLAANIDNLDTALGRSANQFEKNTSLTQEFEAATETLFSQITLLWNRTKQFARLVGAELLPTITSAARSVSDFLGPINEWVQANPELTKQLALVTVGVGGLLTVVGGGLAVLGFFAQGIGAGASALGTMSSFLAPGGTLLSGLGTLIGYITAVGSALSGLITGLGALVGGGLFTGLGILAAIGTAIFIAWDPLTDFFGGLFQGILDGLQPLISAFGGFFDALKPLGSILLSVGKWLVGLVTSAKAGASELSGFATAGRVLGNVLTQFVVTPLRFVVTGLTAGIRFLNNFVGGIAKAVSALSQGNFANAGLALWNGIKNGFTAALSEMGSFFLDAGVSLVESFVGGITSEEARQKIVSGFKDVLSSAREFLPFSPAKRGPLSDLDKTGPAMMSTIAEGLDGSPLQKRLDAVLQGIDGRALTLGIQPDVEIPELPQLDRQVGIQGEGEGRGQTLGPVPTPDVEEQTASIRPQVEGSPPVPTVPDQTVSILPELRKEVPTPTARTVGIHPVMRGGLPQLPERRLRVRPEMEGEIPTPSPVRTSEAAEQVARQEIEMPDRRRDSRQRKEPSEPRPVQMTVNVENNVTVNGEGDADEVQQAVQDGSDDVVRKVKRALEEEKRTGF